MGEHVEPVAANLHVLGCAHVLRRHICARQQRQLTGQDRRLEHDHSFVLAGQLSPALCQSPLTRHPLADVAPYEEQVLAQAGGSQVEHPINLLLAQAVVVAVLIEDQRLAGLDHP